MNTNAQENAAVSMFQRLARATELQGSKDALSTRTVKLSGAATNIAVVKEHQS